MVDMSITFHHPHCDFLPSPFSFAPIRCAMFLEPMCDHDVSSRVYSIPCFHYPFLALQYALSVLSPVLFGVSVGLKCLKILTVLLKHRCGPTTAFVNAGGLDLFRKMVRHLGNFSIMQVAKLLLLPKYAALQGKWGPYCSREDRLMRGFLRINGVKKSDFLINCLIFCG